MIPIETLVENARWDQASDIHLVRGMAPRYRVNGFIREMGGMPLAAEQCDAYARELAGDDYGLTVQAGEAELGRTIAGVRCRVSLFRQRGSWSAAIRLLSHEVPELSELGLPKTVEEFAEYSHGLVLVAGEAGAGKSTTLAAILDRINQNQSKHILTLEAPVEYLFAPNKCVINQREVGRDTKSFAAGLSAALRADPDVILLSELRDSETIETALIAAETGHLVLSTVRTGSAVGAVDHIVDLFPVKHQSLIRLQLSTTLKAVLNQRLLPKAGGGRVAACEVMKTDGTIRRLIREGKTSQLPAAVQAPGNTGNILMDRAMQALLTAGTISRETYENAMQVPDMVPQTGQTRVIGMVR